MKHIWFGCLVLSITVMLQTATAADAIELAVKNNKRNWKYCEAILKRWKEEGRAEKQDRRDDKKSGEGRLDRKIEQLRKRSK